MSSFEHNSTWLYQFSLSVLLGSVLFIPVNLLAEEQPAASAPVQTTPPPPQTERLEALEVSHDYLAEKIVRLANYLDRFFGGNRHYQESNDSAVQLDLTRVAGYGGDKKFNLAAKANLRLPATEGRLHLLLETDPEKNTTQPTQDQAAANNNNNNNNNKSLTPGSKVASSGSLALAGRYENSDENFWHVRTDGGLKFPIPITPFVRTRASFEKPLNEWRLKGSQSLYWFKNLGVGETTQVDLERFISEPMLFRASSNATWLKDTKNFDLRQDFSVYHTLDDRTALLYQASVLGITNPQAQVMDYVVLMLYRRRINNDWVFLELSPQLHFPRERNYRLSPALGMRLELLFEGRK
jgi:hypothetical protein